MQTSPDEAKGDGHHQPPATMVAQVAKGNEVQQHASHDHQHAKSEAKPAVEDGWLARLRSHVWDSWHLDRQFNFFDALTTVVAVIGLYFLVAQAEQTERALREARTANKLTADAMVAGQRAWVTVQGASVRAEPGARAVVAIDVQNTGESPALDVVSVIAVVTSSDVPAQDPVPLKRSSRVVIGKDTVTHGLIASETVITKADYAKILTNELRVFAFGTITYRDIFKVERQTSFCLESRGDGKALNAAMDYCPARNDAK